MSSLKIPVPLALGLKTRFKNFLSAALLMKNEQHSKIHSLWKVPAERAVMCELDFKTAVNMGSLFFFKRLELRISHNTKLTLHCKVLLHLMFWKIKLSVILTVPVAMISFKGLFLFRCMWICLL